MSSKPDYEAWVTEEELTLEQPPEGFEKLFTALSGMVERYGVVEKQRRGIGDSKADGSAPNITRWSMYFGHIIGRLPGDLSPREDKKICFYDGDNVKVEFRRNTSRRSTGYYFPDIDGSEELSNFIRSLCKESVKAIAKLHFGDKPKKGYWQCNLNLYNSEDFLAWHQDDINSKASTFYPISATYILKQPGCPKPCGLSVWYPPKNYNLETESEIRVHDPRDCKFRCRDCGDKPCKKGTVRSLVSGSEHTTKNSVGNPRKLVVLQGGAYTHGKHTVETAWHGPSEQANLSSKRISFNFRLVTEDVWDKLMKASKEPVDIFCQ